MDRRYSPLLSGLIYWIGAVLLLILFGNLTSPPSLADLNLLESLAEWRSPFRDSFFRAISWAGSLYALLPPAALATRWLLRRGWRADALRLGFGLAGTVAGVYLAKVLFHKPRPEVFPLLIPEPPGSSYPSAHVAQIVAVATASCLTLYRHRIRHRHLALLGGVFLAGAVALSRLYLQVHFPADVVGGATFALLWVLALEGLLRENGSSKG
jgi:membrane-associated phospholipid phosphatase